MGKILEMNILVIYCNKKEYVLAETNVSFWHFPKRKQTSKGDLNTSGIFGFTFKKCPKDTEN